MNSNDGCAYNDGEDEYAVQIVRYVDGEMTTSELAEFSQHLEACERCRDEVKQETALSRLFRNTAPLYVAPTGLHKRVGLLLSQSSLPNASKITTQIRNAIASVWQWAARRWVLGLSIAVLALVCVGISRRVVAEFRARDYVNAAVAAHVAALNQQLPLEVRSDDPEAVTRWVDQRVSFNFQLPRVGALPDGSSMFRLAGASLIELKQGRGAMIAYQRQNQVVTLLVAPDSAAVVAGGEKVQDGRLLFHYRNQAGFNVITWYNHGLAYALVSSVAGPARQSCLVCHSSLPAQ